MLKGNYLLFLFSSSIRSLPFGILGHFGLHECNSPGITVLIVYVPSNLAHYFYIRISIFQNCLCVLFGVSPLLSAAKIILIA